MTATRRFLTSRGPLLALLLALPLLAGHASPATADEPAAKPPEAKPGAFDPTGWTTVTDYHPPGDPRAKRVPGSTFTYVWRSFLPTLRTDGPNSNQGDSATAQALMYESLIQVDSETLEFIPCIASHWKIQIHEDKTQTITFHIDERAKWADGRPVQAEDVHASWWHRAQEDRQDPSNVMTYAEGYDEPKVLDPQTVQVHTKQANWRLFYYFGAMQLYPAREIKIPGDRYLEEFNWKYQTGSGPYVFEDMKKGEWVQFRRRNDWWAENERWAKNTWNFDKIRFVVIRDLELQYEKFKKGELDWFDVRKAQRWVEEVPNEPSVKKGWIQMRKVWTRQPVGFSGLAFNQRKWPFDDIRVRLAFAHLFNRERLMEKLFFNEYEFTHSTYPGSDWGAEDEIENVPFDAARAEELLAEAGYKDRDEDGYLVRTSDRKRLEVTLEYNLAEYERIWLLVKEDFENAGIKFNLKLLDPSTLYQKVDERQFTITHQTWGSLLFPNPETSWRSDLADKNYNNNITGFKNARVDELCKAYNLAMDRSEQRRIVKEIDRLVCAEHPYAFGWHTRAERVLYWDKFGHPDSYLDKVAQKLERSMMPLWWLDEERAKALKDAMANEKPLPVAETNVAPWG